MTLKEFEEIKSMKSQEEYEVWFHEHANFMIRIGVIWLPCIKLTRSKVALQNKSIFPVGPEEELRELKDRDSREVAEKQRFLQIYDTLSFEDRWSVKEYFDLLKKTTEMENRYRQKKEFPEKIFCSFCGRPEEKCKKIIASPSNVFICDECIDICNEIMEDERKNEGLKSQ